MSDDTPHEPMVRVLFRWEIDDRMGYYAGNSHDGTIKNAQDFVIGVCRTPKGVKPQDADTLQRFQQHVEEVATHVKWFDKDLEEL